MTADKDPSEMSREERMEWAVEEMERQRAAPKPPAGWYPHDQMVDTVRYWDGDAWTDHVAPAGTAGNAHVHTPAAGAATQTCPYCRGLMDYEATRCPHCQGELRWCMRCNDLVATTSQQKFVGMMRGGMKTRVSCSRCGKTLDGPRW